MRLRHHLEHPLCRRAALSLALLLLLPSVSDRLVLDDHVLALLSRSEVPVEGLAHGRWGLFSFTLGESERNHALMDEGALLPWWSAPDHLNAFLRPLSTLSHRFDFTAFPDAPWLMHVHSLLWYLLLLLGCRRVYDALTPQEAGGRTLATLALCLFALDDAHGATVSWLSNRNAIIAATVGLPALLLHHRYRAEGQRHGLWLGPLFFLGGLLGGEAAVGLLAYIAAYALVLDRGSLRSRALSLLPYVAVLVAWQLVYRDLGLGSAGSGAYHDPGREPLAFAGALARNLPILLAAQLGPVVADAGFWGYPPLIATLWGAAIVTLAVVAWAAAPALRTREARFWGLGMLLAAVPVSASLPGERLLLIVGIGGSAFLACTLWPLVADAAQGTRRKLLWGLCLLHLVAAPLALPLRAYSMPALGAVIDAADESLPDAVAPDERWVIVNAPFDAFVAYIQVARAQRGLPRPAHLNWLATASSPIELRRSGAAALDVHPARGFLSSPPEQHYRRDVTALGAGAHVTLDGLDVEILSVTDDGRPDAARFRFARPLSDPKLRFFSYEDGHFHPFIVPPQGSPVEFPAQDFFAVVIGEFLGSSP